MKKKAIIAGGLGIVLIAIIVIIIALSGRMTASTMRINEIEGTVILVDDGGKEQSPVVGRRLQDGNILDTKEDSKAVVSLDDDRLVYMLEFSRARFNKSGKIMKLSMEDGSTFFYIAEKLADDESFEIETSTMIIGVRGTSGYVLASEDGPESVTITSGKVSVYCNKTGENYDVNAGQKMSVVQMDGEWVVGFEDIYALPNEVLEIIESDRILYDEVSSFINIGELLSSAGIVGSGKHPYINSEGYVVFGAYEQDGNPDNGPEPIEWILVSSSDTDSLLLSRYVLDALPYNEDARSVTWEKCTLRKWLNDDFYNSAFNQDEQAFIHNAFLNNPGNPWGDGADGGKDTEDKVFLLSVEETLTLFSWNEYSEDRFHGYSQELMAAPTAYAVTQGAQDWVCPKDHYDDMLKPMGFTDNIIGQTYSSWRLRSSLQSNTSACVIGCNGAGGWRTGNEVEKISGIRPAIRVDGI